MESSNRAFVNVPFTNTRMAYLNRLWDEVADRFGFGSVEVNDMNEICDYWEKHPQPTPIWTDANYRTEIAGLKNEMRRRQGYQPWDERFKQSLQVKQRDWVDEQEKEKDQEREGCGDATEVSPSRSPRAQGAWIVQTEKQG